MSLYQLRCRASWTSADLAELLGLFKEKSVNVRRLFLMEAFDQSEFTNLEIHFSVDDSPFLETLQKKLTALKGCHFELRFLERAA